jgi:hypothetical protein
VKLASIYHHDRQVRAAIVLQRWFREFRMRRQISKRYWYMLRGVFKFKYFLRKFRDRIEKQKRELNILLNTSALKI